MRKAIETKVITKPLPNEVIALLVITPNGRCLCVGPGQELTEEIRQWMEISEDFVGEGAHILYRKKEQEGVPPLR